MTDVYKAKYHQLLEEYNSYCTVANEQIKQSQAESDALREAVQVAVDTWDWWQEDSYDRCASLMWAAMDECRAALASGGGVE